MHNINKFNQQEELDGFLRLICHINSNHHRTPIFLHKIQQILFYLEHEIKQTYSKIEIFDLFKNDRAILLFLIEREIITFDQLIVEEILFETEQKRIKNCHFFLPEIKPFLSKEKFQEIEDEILAIDPNALVNFDEKRHQGENDSIICRIIRQDSIKEFVIYVNRTNFPLSSKIQQSIFETNPFLIGKEPSLIEYAAFFGSIKIFLYLQMNQVELTSSLLLYAIHSQNPRMIHLIEDCHIYAENDIFIESIKCHHNNVSFYIENTKNVTNEKEEIFVNAFRYHNYMYWPKYINENDLLLYLHQYNYNYLEVFKILIETKKKDIKSMIQAADKNQLEIIYFLLLQKNNIDEKLFEKCEKLRHIIIPSSIESIGDYAFFQCTSLVRVSIPSSVTAIGSYAFSECSSIDKVLIPTSVKILGDHLFDDCTSLTEIVIPSSITKIPNYAFSRCSSLVHVIIPSSVVSIGNYSFYNCSSIRQIFVPSSVEEIAFAKCSSLSHISLLSIKAINAYTFFSCTSLAQITIPPSVNSIEDFAFRQCTALTEVYIPKSVGWINKQAFTRCESLRQITLPYWIESDTIEISPNVKVIRLPLNENNI